MSTYSGKVVKWDDAINSKNGLADFDSFASMNDTAPVQPDDSGHYPTPVPGETKSV